MLKPIFEFLTVDPSLGRIDYSLLSDQALMEILFDGMRTRNETALRDENGNFKDIFEWEGIKCIGDSVSKITMYGKLVSDKQFPFDFIPPRVTVFEGGFANLHGTLDPSVLPMHLIKFIVHYNKLRGSVNIGSFPEKLQDIGMSNNHFSGSLDLSSLPASIIKFEASGNNFSGEVSLNDLPPAIKELWISANALSGSISITNLPETITDIHLEENALEGDFRLLEIPPNLHFLNFWENKWDGVGTIVFPRHAGQERMNFYLNSSLIAVVDEYGNSHPWEKEILENWHELDL